MPLAFQTLMSSVGVAPSEFAFIRHRSSDHPTPFTLWRDDLDRFERYQSTQSSTLQATLNGRYWASFVDTPDKRTMFVGVYRGVYVGPVKEGVYSPRNGSPAWPGDQFNVDRTDLLNDLIGKLFLKWSAGRNMTRRGDNPHFVESIERDRLDPPFEGYHTFVRPLSAIPDLYPSWRDALSRAKGIYIVTCPRDGVHYVGQANGADGFYGRWCAHAAGGGASLGFKLRDPSAYNVAILQLADNIATADDIDRMERLWIAKLQSRAMGINMNGPAKPKRGY